MSIIGHQKQWQYLKQSAESGRLAHAYLFYGPSKIGKKKVALDFSQLLQPEPSKLANFFLIEPLVSDEEDDKESKRAGIHIAQIQKLKEKLSLAVAGQGYKVAVIDEAFSMTSAAQAAMLKLLEEPKGKTLLILIAESPNQLLPTIVSRCQLIGFNLLAKKELADYLDKQKIGDREKKIALWFSFGKPGRVIDYLNNKEERAFLKQKIEQIREMTQAPLYKRFQLAHKLSENREECLATLEIWLHYFRAILLKKLQPTKADLKITKNYTSQQLTEIINFIEKAKFIIASTNTKPRLALEVLLMKV